MNHYGSIEAEKIRQELEQLERQREELQRALEQKRQQAKRELAERIKEMIITAGYDLNDICPLVVGSRRYRTAKRSLSREKRHYRKFADPKHPERVYSRGPLPWWMREMMQEKGYDVNDKAAREAFKMKHLRLLED